MCDSWDFNASGHVVFVGGRYYQTGNRGVFGVAYTELTSTNADIGSRVLKLP